MKLKGKYLGAIKGPCDPSVKAITFYAYGATIGQDASSYDISSCIQASANDDTSLGSKQIGFVQTISSDDVLAGAMVKELSLRRISPGKTEPDRAAPTFGPASSPGKQHLALIYEQDTYYGRFILKTFEEKFGKDTGDKPKTGCIDTRNNLHCDWIHELAYLRGLDGALPPKSSEASQKLALGFPQSERAQDAPSAAKPATDSQSLERPFGPGQYDYLRRMAKRLKKEDDDLRRDGGAGIRAIGILGDDVHDKLLVLRAFHPEFPEAVFFTTDWDAALTMPSELDWSRNLLVASSFGPELHESIRGDAPPFRSNYQSSIFLATRLAIEEGICGRPRWQALFWRFERFGRLRSYVRPVGAEHMSAGHDEVRRPGSLSGMRALRS